MLHCSGGWNRSTQRLARSRAISALLSKRDGSRTRLVRTQWTKERVRVVILAMREVEEGAQTEIVGGRAEGQRLLLPLMRCNRAGEGEAEAEVAVERTITVARDVLARWVGAWAEGQRLPSRHHAPTDIVGYIQVIDACSALLPVSQHRLHNVCLIPIWPSAYVLDGYSFLKRCRRSQRDN